MAGASTVATRRLARAALAVAALGAAYGARAAAGYEAVARHPALALVLWGAAMVLAALAFWPGATTPTATVAHRWERRDAAVALAIFALALGLRVYALGERPMLGGDEAGWGVHARTVLERGGNPFGFGYFDMPALGEYLTALALRLGGVTIEALRLPSAVAGAALAALVVVVATRLAGRLAGAAAGIVCATMLVHVHLSRQGVTNVFDGLTALVTLAALERGWVERRPLGFAIAGAALALSQHFYASARVIPVVAIAWIALRCVAEGRRAAERGPLLAMFAFVACVGAWPQIGLAIHDPARWMAPITRVSLSRSLDATDVAPWLVALAPRLRDAALGFVAVPLRGVFVPQVPLLAPFAAILFAAGTVALVRRWREPFAQLAALWIGGVVAMAALSESTPAGQRYAIAVPIAAIVAGVGASALARLAARLTPRAASATATVVLAALAFEGAWHMDRYFVRMPPWLGGGRDVRGEIALDFATRLGAAPSARAVMLGAPQMWYRGFHHLAFLRPGTVARDVEAHEAVAPAVAAGCGVAVAPPAGREPVVDCLVAVLAHREGDVPAIRAAVVVVHDAEVRAADGTPLYRLIEACAACGAPAGAGTGPAVSSTR